jgi:DNA (cytosine-5)-methyltransferase 1
LQNIDYGPIDLYALLNLITLAATRRHSVLRFLDRLQGNGHRSYWQQIQYSSHWMSASRWCYNQSINILKSDRIGKYDLCKIVNAMLQMNKKWAYYNEYDPNAAEWLRQLILLGQIPEGFVDERSIIDVAKDIDSIKSFQQWHFFAGIGVIPYALRQAGWSDDREILSGSCPCQSFSVAGKQKGFDDDRHLWPYMFRIIQESGIGVVIGEQVSSKLEWWDAVASDLESADYAAAAFDLPGASIGAYHRRYRLFWVGISSVADSSSNQWRGESGREVFTEFKASGENGALEHPLSQQQQKLSQSWADESQHVTAKLRSDSSPLGHTNGEQPEIDITRISTNGDRSTGHHSTTEDRSRSTPIWGNTHWLQCSDGKYRAADQDIYPLVGVVGMDKPRIRLELERGLTELLPPGNAIKRTEEIEGIAKLFIDNQNWGAALAKSRFVAHGSAADLESCGELGGGGAEDPQKFRAMKLKGAGNAIVAPLMRSFIENLMSIL